MRYKLKVYTIHELGNRANQEDSIFPSKGKESDTERLFLVCDGMGGHESGEVASGTVCEAMSQSILKHCPDQEGVFTDEYMQLAVRDAFDALDAKGGNVQDQHRKMGTTMTCLKLHSQGATIAHIGDSRVYHIRPGKTGKETQILHVTRDHSLINDLIASRNMTEEEAQTSRQKNVITRAMQPCMERRAKPDIYHTHDIKAGDYFYLCSDGMLEQEEWDNRYVKNNFSDDAGTDDAKIQRLISATCDNADNHSAVIVHILNVTDGKNVKTKHKITALVDDLLKCTDKCINKVLPKRITSKRVHLPVVYFVFTAIILFLTGFFVGRCSAPSHKIQEMEIQTLLDTPTSSANLKRTEKHVGQRQLEGFHKQKP